VDTVAAMAASGNRRRVPAIAVALPWAVWAALRASGVERGFPLVPAMSFTPYAAATWVLPLAAAVRAGSRTAGLMAAGSGAVLAGTVLARARSSPHAAAGSTAARGTAGGGPKVRIATASLRRGLVPPGPVVDLVRRLDVDVLAVQELTPDAETGLRASGIDDFLPWAHVLPARPGSVASASGAIWTRLPARAAGAVPGTFEQPTVAIDVPGARAIEVTAIHTAPPSTSSRAVRDWTADLAALPAPDTDVLRVLAGDFNATGDHAALRAVLRGGWVDAARQGGRGLSWTWRPLLLPWPRLTIDRVLVDARIRVAGVDLVHLPGSDHRALVVDLVLPAG
jgi:endonuclease/exonuclease/phosphatase family metal-dependent hydrolase